MNLAHSTARSSDRKRNRQETGSLRQYIELRP